MEWKRQIYNTLGTSKRWTASDQCVESCHCQLLLTTVCCGLHGNIYCNNNNNRVSHYIVQLVNLKVWAHFHLMYNVLLVLLLLLLLLLQQLHADAKVLQQVFQASSGLPPVSRSLWLSYPIICTQTQPKPCHSCSKYNPQSSLPYHNFVFDEQFLVHLYEYCIEVEMNRRSFVKNYLFFRLLLFPAGFWHAFSLAILSSSSSVRD